MEPWRLNQESWMFCRPVVEDSQHLDEELDPDPDPHQSEKSDQDPLLSEKMRWIKIRNRIK
jgi:hypothetical protein